MRKSIALEIEDGNALREKRRHQRVPADGCVHLALNFDGSVAVEVPLVDTSVSGFRTIHECPALVPGKVVRFEFSPRAARSNPAQAKSGWAKVIWTRTQGVRMESGFYIVLPD